MKKQVKAVLAKLDDCQGDITKEWFVFYYALDPDTNKLERFKVYKGFYKCATAEEKYAHAEALIKKINRQLREGWSPFDKKDKIFADETDYAAGIIKPKVSSYNWNYYMSQIITERSPGLRPASIIHYKGKYRKFLSWLRLKKMDQLDISFFTNEHSVAFFNYLRVVKKLAPKTYNNYRQLFQSTGKALVKKKVWTENHFLDIARLKTSPTPGQFLRDEVLTPIISIAKLCDKQLWLFELFIYYTFIRPKELRFLKIGDIDFIGKMIEVRGDISKNHKTQSVVIPEFLFIKLIENGYNNYPKDHYVFSVKKCPDVKHVGQNYFGNRFRKLKCLVPGITKEKMYHFKHTGAIHAHKAAIPLKNIQDQMRHHSLDETARYIASMEVKDSPELRNNWREL